MSTEQFNYCFQALLVINLQPKIEVTSAELLELFTGPECFDIRPSFVNANWPTVIHDTDKEGVFYFKDEKFQAHHYACREAFQKAILAHGGVECKRCHQHHRDIVDYCNLCAKVIAVYPEEKQDDLPMS